MLAFAPFGCGATSHCLLERDSEIALEPFTIGKSPSPPGCCFALVTLLIVMASPRLKSVSRLRRPDFRVRVAQLRQIVEPRADVALVSVAVVPRLLRRIVAPVRMLGRENAGAELIGVRAHLDLRRIDLRRDVAFEGIAEAGCVRHERLLSLCFQT